MSPPESRRGEKATRRAKASGSASRTKTQGTHHAPSELYALILLYYIYLFSKYLFSRKSSNGSFYFKSNKLSSNGSNSYCSNNNLSCQEEGSSCSNSSSRSFSLNSLPQSVLSPAVLWSLVPPRSRAPLLWPVAPIFLLECSQLRSHRWSSSKLPLAPLLNRCDNRQFNPNLSSSSDSLALHRPRHRRETPLSLPCLTCRRRPPLRRRHTHCQPLQSFSRRSNNNRPR